MGSLEINTSMRCLDFETRSEVAKECISRVCEESGIPASSNGVTTGKRNRADKRIMRMLAEKPNTAHSGVTASLTITSSFLNVTAVESGEVKTEFNSNCRTSQHLAA